MLDIRVPVSGIPADGCFREAYDRADRIMRRVHPPLGLRKALKFSEFHPAVSVEVRGRYVPDCWSSRPLGNTGTLFFRDDASDAGVLALIHEFGHVLDHLRLGKSHEELATDRLPGGPLAGWWTAAEDSFAVRTLRRMRAECHGAVWAEAGGIEHKVDHRRLDYLLSPQEIFGRAYVQWVADRSGSRVLWREMARLRAIGCGPEAIFWVEPPMVWDPEDDREMLLAMDKMLAATGMLKAGAQ